jgi:methylated-DNA-[protein]-cysteine S-methyltransferase
VWYCLIFDENGFLLSFAFSLKSRTEALSHAKSKLLRGAVVEEDASDDILNVIKALSALYDGKKAYVNLRLSFNGFSDFSKKILNLVSKIPRGQVTTYGSIATVLGNSSAARAVGAVVSRNPFPLIIPCHRVVKADLSIGEYSLGRLIKKMLLEKEKVVLKYNFKRKDYFVLKKFIYKFPAGAKNFRLSGGCF